MFEYLIQSKLEAALKQLVGVANWRGREIRLPNSRRRWDMAYMIDGHTTVVDFDGDQHYRDSLKIKVDNEKDRVASSLGYSVFRIPYWVQLTDETVEYYFGMKAKISQDFPHGFIETKIFPASFCEMGVDRFTTELLALPKCTQSAVIASLRDRVQEHGTAFVLPNSLLHLLSGVER